MSLKTARSEEGVKGHCPLRGLGWNPKQGLGQPPQRHPCVAKKRRPERSRRRPFRSRQRRLTPHVPQNLYQVRTASRLSSFPLYDTIVDGIQGERGTPPSGNASLPDYIFFIASRWEMLGDFIPQTPSSLRAYLRFLCMIRQEPSDRRPVPHTGTRRPGLTARYIIS